jgi:hypothetical protein
MWKNKVLNFSNVLSNPIPHMIRFVHRVVVVQQKYISIIEMSLNVLEKRVFQEVSVRLLSQTIDAMKGSHSVETKAKIKIIDQLLI